MNIKKIAALSFTKNDLDPEKVNLIKEYLKRKELKEYIKELSRIINKKTVVVISALPIDEQSRKKISSIFYDKKIEYDIDHSLVMGIKIIENDNIYEFNLKKTLEDISSHVIDAYD